MAVFAGAILSVIMNATQEIPQFDRLNPSAAQKSTMRTKEREPYRRNSPLQLSQTPEASNGP